MPVVLNDEQRNDLVKDYQGGLSYKELSDKYGVGKTTARDIVVKSGVETRVAYNKTTGRKCSPEKEQEIIAAYQSGLSFQKVADLHGVNSTNVRLTLVRYGIPIRTLSEAAGKRKLSFSDEDTICEKYRSGMTMAELGKEYNVDDTTILGVLRRKEEPSRKTKENQYTLDEHFFDVIDTEEKAYFFGILYADGNVASDSPSIVMSLQEKDKYLVEKLNSLVTTDRPVLMRTYDDDPKHQRQFGLTMYSQHMKDTLVSYGMVPAKSLVKMFPRVILDSSEDIQRHFIRGYFDGNGSIGFYERVNRLGYSYVITIASTKDMCDNILKLLEQHCDATGSIYKRVNIYAMQVGGPFNVMKVCKWMYQDATLYMKRKESKYREILSHYP